MSHSFFQLEPRLLFDASTADTSDHIHDDAGVHAEFPGLAYVQDDAGAAEARHDAEPAEQGGQDLSLAEAPLVEIFVIDASVHNPAEIEKNLSQDAVIIRLDADADGITALSQALSAYGQVDALHVFSHGSDGEVRLGTAILNDATLSERAGQVAGWSSSFSENGDMLLYGCDVAQSEKGQAFIGELARLTGVDVAASSDATGAAEKGGDWILEYRVGDVETRAVDADGYRDLLATPVLGGITATTNINDTATTTPFSSVTITDADDSDSQTVTITLDTAAKGALSNLGTGSFDAGTGVYTFTGTADQAQAAVRGLVFTPTENHVAPGGTETTTFTISVNDGSTTVTDSATTVVVTSVNDTPVAVADDISATEDTDVTPTGNVLSNDTDMDIGDTKTVTAVRLGDTVGEGAVGIVGTALTGTYGKLNLAANGDYTYTLDNNSLSVQTLGAGQSLTENFNYTMRDANGLTSDAVITVSIHGTNDAPVGTAASLVVTTPIPENASDAENPGVLASTLLQSVSRASLVIDVDSTDTTPGLVAYASSTTNGMTGTWQYQLSGSSTWNAFTPSISEAILIPHDALVRFVVDNSGIDSQESGKATLSYRVWDASSGSAGGTLAVTSSGGSTSISDASIDATFNVAARNDAPTLTPVQLDLNEGATAVITTATLPLLDPDNASEQLTYRVEVLPTHGQLLKNGIPVLVGSLFTQADIISGTISYRHTASELSLDQVDSVSFSVRDGAGGVISSVSLPIQIHDVNAQIAITGASQSVLEYVSGPATYTELNLGLSDADGNANLMTLTINTLPDAAVGKLQYWNGSAYVDVTAGTALTQAALLAHPLRFISTGAEPSAHPSATFTVTATDGHTTLAPTTASSAVTITIIAQNDPPSPETQTLPVNTTTPNPAITTAYLTATDPDSPDSKRVYTVSSNPAYGDLYLNGIQIGVGSTFTQADLDANHLTFHIDGGIFASDTPDSFNFRINDGDGGVSSGTLDITIAAGTYTGGGGPGGTLTGLTPEGLFTTVTSTILNNSESYTLTDLPDHGTLYFNGVALGLSGTFAQADIDTGAVVYVHDGTEPSGHAYADAFTVSRTGGTVSGSSSISLTITPVNDAPTITQTSGGATLLEHNTAGGDADSFDLTDVSNAVKLTTANVQAHDVESGPSELYYVLAQSPGTAGSIKQWNDTSSSWVALAQDARFSAQDVADGKIAYFHDPASEERSVSISVYLIDGGVVEVGDVVISGNAVSERNYATVTDGDTNSIQITKGNVAQSPTRTITFTINNVNDAPTASDTSFTVEEGAPSLSGQPDDNPGRIQVLNASILSASDSDNDLAMATYFIKTLPSYGRIEVDTNNDGTFDKILGASDLNGSGYIFTKAQLDGGRLRYVQDGSDQTLDNFSWGLNDNATTTPVNQDSNSATVTINILPVNDPPIVYKNEAITVTEGASYTITTAYLGSGTTSDIDSDNSALQTQYRVTTPPVQHGTLYLEKDGVITILGTGASFTLADIQAGYLKYTHNGSDPHLNNFEDGFGFTISDASGMTEPSGHFKINLTAVNDAPTLTPSIFGTTEYVEDASPVAIGSTVVFSDSDLKDATTLTPSLDGGTLEIAITNAQAGDILSVINAGLGAGQIGVSGNSVTFGGVQIGTIDNTKNGVSGQTLLITFNSNVTSDAEVQALIRAIGFSSSDTANPATVTRDLTITYDADGAGGDATQTVTGTASVTVTQINDRPELTSQSPNLGTVSEDLAAPYVTTTVSGLVGTSIDDVDTGAVEGIAITGLTNAATGKWQYSTNGSTWSDVGTVSTTSALLLRSTDFIRFVPDGKNGGTATISYKAWDQTSGNFGTKANTTANDTQTSAFSTATDTAQITVTDLNDAPTGTGNLTLTSTVEDTSNPTGAVINTLAGLNFQDVDSGSSLAGVLIVGNSANAGTQGVWEYSTDGNWKAIGTVADDATALALSATTQIRFVPAANYNGTPPALTIRAVDNTYTGSFSTTTEGAETRSTVNSSANGGTTAISGTTNTISTAVTPVNDTPTISGDKTINSVVTEGSALVISNVAAGLVVVRDVEASRNEGGTNRGQVSVTIAVPNGTTHGIVTLGSTSNVTITAGADSSASVTIKGTLENVNAALNGLSFTPGDDTNTSETVTVTVNDLGNSGTGTTTPLTATQTITIGAITPVNDAPTASGPSSVTATEDVQFSFTGGNTLRIADVDARTGTVEVALSIPSGMLIMTTTGVSVTSGDSGTGAITIHGTVSAVNAALGTLKYIGAADANSNNIDDNSRTLHMVVSDLGNSIGDSTTTPGTVSKDVLIVLNPVNDAPTLIIAGGSESQSLNQNTQASITGITVADYKDSGDSDYAVTAKPTLVITALHGTFEAFNQGNVNGVLSNENRTITLSSSNIGADSLTDINGVITAGYLKYTADSNFSGTDTLSLVLHDNGNSGGTDRTSSGTIALTIAGTNEAPSFGSLDATPTFVEDGPTVILDDDAILVDPELSVYNNWGNAVLTLQRTGQAGNAGIPATDDVFGLTGSGSTGVNFNGGNIRIASTAVGTFTNADGVLTITFAEGTTTAQATQVLRAVTYQNTNDNPPTQVSIGYTINDGDTDADRATNGQGTGGPKTGNGSINVTIAANNDTPSLNVPSTGSYTEDAASITLASAAALDDPELSFLATQNGDWERATLSLSRSGGAIASDVFGVTGSGDTGVNFDGGNIRINTTAVGTFTNAGGKLTITFAHNATSAQVEQIVRAITYENTRQSLAAGETESVALVWTLNDGNTGDANTPGPQGLGGAKQTTATETITLTGVNDAPVLADTALSITVAEDAAAPSGGVGVLVSSLTGGISDVDTTNPKGIAITGLDSTLGTWRYSTNGGTTWTSIDAVADSSSLLLRSTDRIHFQPTANINGSVSAGLTIRAWDQSTGSAGAKVDTTTTGGTSAFSSVTDNVALTVTAVNDAPTRTQESVALTPVDEDSTNPSGSTISSLFTAAFSDATDQVTGGSSANTLAGVAIVGNAATASQGTWQYFNGSSWTNIATTVSLTSATLFAENTAVRFVPTADFHGTPGALTTRLIDSSSGAVTNATGVNIGTTGGTTRFSDSSNEVTLTTGITAVNDAPVATGSATLSAIDEDTANGSIPGATITSLFGSNYNDVTDNKSGITGGGNTSTTLRGVIITGYTADVAKGEWEYKTDSGNWTSLPSVVTDTSGFAVAAADSLRFVPVGDYNGDAPDLVVRLVDGSGADIVTGEGLESRVDASENGDTTRYSLNTVTLSHTITAVADIAADTQTVDEDGDVTTNLLGNDSFEGTPVITSVTQGANGTVTIVDANAGTVKYTPGANFNGTDSYTYTVTSGGVTETATVTVTINQIDDPATIGGDISGSGTEDGGAIAGTLTATDPADGLTDGTIFSVTTAAGNGMASIDAASGAWTYTPNADYNGSDSFVVTITDDDGNTTTQTINLTVTAVADIAADTQSVDEDGDVTTNLLSNDSFEGTPVITSVTQGTNGTVVNNGDGTVKYTPGANFNGTDSYTYTVTSGGVTETATVTVTINQIDDPATIGGDISGSGVEDGGAITGTLTASDAADGLTDGTIFSVTTAAGNGMASIDAASGAWTYTPNADYNGSDSFVVTITDDDGNTTTQTINLTVTAVADIASDTQTVDEDEDVTTNLLGNDSFDNAGRTITSVGAASNGTVEIVDAALGTVKYTPNVNFNGSDSYTYTVTSGGVTETATVNVTVNQVNDPAVFGGNTSGSGAEDGGDITGILTVSDTADGMTTPNFRIETGDGPSHGTATINATTGTWSYTPTADYNGVDSFTVSVTDDDGNVETQTINLAVTAVADIAADTQTVDEDGDVTTNLLSNDSFEGTPAITSVTQGTHGAVVNNGDGTITYTPNANYHGADSYTYTVTSPTGVTETATVNVAVNPVVDLVAADDSFSGAEDTTISGSVAGNDATTSGGALSFFKATDPGHGTVMVNADGTFTYTPVADYNGMDSFTYTVTDAASGETQIRTVNLDVTLVADIAADSVSTNADTSIITNVLGNDTFEGIPVVSVENGDGPAHGVVTVNPDGTVTYTPDRDYFGPDEFTYTVTSGGVTETAVVSVTVARPVYTNNGGGTPGVSTLPGAGSLDSQTGMNRPLTLVRTSQSGISFDQRILARPLELSEFPRRLEVAYVQWINLWRDDQPHTSVDIPPEALSVLTGTEIRSEARQADGSPLPFWVRFDQDARALRVTVPSELDREGVTVKVWFWDEKGNEAVVSITLNLDRDATEDSVEDASQLGQWNTEQNYSARPGQTDSVALSLEKRLDEQGSSKDEPGSSADIHDVRVPSAGEGHEVMKGGAVPARTSFTAQLASCLLI